MFVRSKYHLAQLERLKSELSFVHSREVDLYRARILDLHNQIADLKELVFPQNNSQKIPDQARELDSGISASEKPPEMSEADLNKMLAGERELDLLVSGNYDMDLLN